ncbi:MAG: histidine phosphatase family protein [Pseudomonadota bacterium]
MRDLILYRHAKSSWDDLDLDDFERPLSPRGAKAAPRMGNWLSAQRLIPDCVLCSTSVRTRATLMLSLNEMEAVKPKLVFEDALYLANPSVLLNHIRAVSDDARCCMVLGHNPGLHALALELTGQGRKRDITQLAIKFPTAAIAHLRFEGESWSSVQAACGQLVQYVTPRTIS